MNFFYFSFKNDFFYDYTNLKNNDKTMTIDKGRAISNFDWFS